MIIEFDPAKDATNRKKHGVSLAAAADFVWQDAMIELDDRFDYGEDRLSAIGFIGAQLYVLVYSDRDQKSIRVISLRKATKREIDRYVHQ